MCVLYAGLWGIYSCRSLTRLGQTKEAYSRNNQSQAMICPPDRPWSKHTPLPTEARRGSYAAFMDIEDEPCTFVHTYIRIVHNYQHIVSTHGAESLVRNASCRGKAQLVFDTWIPHGVEFQCVSNIPLTVWENSGEAFPAVRIKPGAPQRVTRMQPRLCCRKSSWLRWGPTDWAEAQTGIDSLCIAPCSIMHRDAAKPAMCVLGGCKLRQQ